MLPRLDRVPRTAVALAASVIVLLGLSGCALKHPVGDLVAGKILFAKTCGSCHTLSHANTAGTTGPNLDDAFRQDRVDGINRTAIEGLVDYWIQYPNDQGVMPARLLTGQQAENVASYVAAVAARPGKDTGALANAGGVSGTTAADGLAVFNGVGGCASCHTLAAAGSHGVVGPNLDEHLRSDCASAQSKAIRGATLDACIYAAITKPYAYLPAGFKAGVMPPNFAQTLSKTELTALVNFLSTAAK
jgi:mono/diheme cytochrome c family protein